MPTVKRFCPIQVLSNLALVVMLTASASGFEAPLPERVAKVALWEMREDQKLTQPINGIAQDALAKFSEQGLAEGRLAITLVTLPTRGPARFGQYHGDQPIYPASVVKLCYAMAFFDQVEKGQLTATPELLEQLRLMIVDSSNQATGHILDALTGTQSGTELTAEELKAFGENRQVVNHYLRALGVNHINACQKTWDDAPYGRDVQYLGPNYENRNSMTTNDTAQLLYLLARNKVLTKKHREHLWGLMHRDYVHGTDPQSRRIGAGLPSGSTLYSKAGWTSDTNHDTALVTLPDGRRFILVVFTRTSYQYPEIVAYITERVVGLMTSRQ